MKTLLRAGGLAVLVAATVALAAAADFSKSLSPEDFAAAGLGKLTPDELARLDALVRQERSGEVAKVRQETEAKVRAEVAAEKPAEGKKGRASLLGRMKVLLTPGADIEYATVRTELVGPFRGYERGQVLTLANGQTWQVVDGSYWAPKRDENKVRHVVIMPGSLGSFFLEIEDGGRPKVKLVSNGGQ